jgi:RHS repeat-associated protein
MIDFLMGGLELVHLGQSPCSGGGVGFVPGASGGPTGPTGGGGTGYEEPDDSSPGYTPTPRTCENPHPIVATHVGDWGDAPPQYVKAELIFDGIPQGPVYYQAPILGEGEVMRITLQADASGLPTGHYPYEIEITEHYDSENEVTYSVPGGTEVFNRSQSEFGNRVWLDGLDRIYVDEGGAALIRGDGSGAWFPEDESGALLTPPGSFSTLEEQPGGGYLLAHKDTSYDEFDADGMLLRRVDRNGNEYVYQYTDADGDMAADELSTITDPLGRTVTYQYSDGLLERIVDHVGREVLYDYEPDTNRVDSITYHDPDGPGDMPAPSFVFDYDPATNLLNRLTDAGGGVTQYQYDPDFGRLTSVTYDNGTSEQITPLELQGLVDQELYDSPSSLAPALTLTDNNDVRALHVDQLSNQTEYATDRAGRIAARKDADGNLWLYERDPDGQITYLTEPDPDGEGDLRAPQTSFEYDDRGNLVSVRHPDHSLEQWTYDAQFNQVTSHLQETGQLTKYQIDPANGNLLGVTQVVGQDDASSSENDDVMSAFYTYADQSSGLPNGMLLTEADGGGGITRYTYYPQNYLIEKVIRPGITDTSIDDADAICAGSAWTAEYGAGRGGYRWHAAGGSASTVLTWRFEGLDSLKKYDVFATWVADPAAATNAPFTIAGAGYSHSAQVNQTAAPYDDTLGSGFYRLATVQPNLGTIEVTLTNEANGNVMADAVYVREIGLPFTEYQYDQYGNLDQVTDELGRVTEYDFDQRDRLVEVRSPDPDPTDGVDERPATRYEYDANDNQTKIIEGYYQGSTFYELATTEDIWCAMGCRVIQTVDPDPDGAGPLRSPVTDYTYTPTRDVKTAVDPLGRVTRYEYNSLGQTESVIPPAATDARGDDPDAAYAGTWNEVTGSGHGGSYRWHAAGSGANTTTWTFQDLDDTKQYQVFATWVVVPGAATNAPFTISDASGDQTYYANQQQAPADGTMGSGYYLLGTADPSGGTITVALGDNANGTVIADAVYVLEAVRPSTDYTYDVYGNLKTVTDPRGNVTEYVCDERHRLVVATEPDPDGAGGSLPRPVTKYEYDDAGQLTKATRTTDAPGAVELVLEYEYDYLGRQTLITFPDPDGGGPLAGPVTEYVYDDAGQLIRTSQKTADPADPELITEYAYDGRGRQVRVTAPDPDGAGPLPSPVTEYVYNDAGQLVRTIQKTADPSDPQIVTQYEYDQLGRQTKVILPDPDGAGTEYVSPVIEYEYDIRGNLVKETDPLGSETDYTYDTLRRLETVTGPDPDDGGPLGRPVTLYTYDAGGQLVELTEPGDRVTRYRYDALGRQVRVTLPDPDTPGGLNGPVFTYTYDATGNLIAETDPLGNQTDYAYDALNRLETVTRPAPEQGQPRPVTEYGYDALGRMETVTDPLGQVTTYEYDALDRQTKVIPPDPDGAGDELAPWTEYAYTASGDLQAVTDRLGHATTYDYDFLHRRIEETDANGDTTHYAFDRQGNLQSLTDPVGNTTTWTYDYLGRVTTETNQPGHTRSFTYDDAGNLVEKIDRSGRVTEYDYDNFGRLEEERWMDGASPAHTISFTYNEAGELASVGDAFASYGYGYDGLGRIENIGAQIAGLTPSVLFTQDFDDAGRRRYLEAQIGTVNDFRNDYGYDDLGRMTLVTQAGQGGNAVAPKRVKFDYDATDRWDVITRYADLAGTQVVAMSQYTFDFAGRITDLTHAKGVTTLADYDWDWDEGSRITQFVSLTDGTVDYGHDDRDQLTSADYDYQGDESYTYDENGNRTNAGYETGDNNQLESDGVYDYDYDNEGNRVARFIDNDASDDLSAGDTDVTEYEWDYRNRLVSVTDSATYEGAITQLVAYDYDPFNRLVHKGLDPDGDGPALAEDTFFVYDGNQVALQFDGTEATDLSHRYLWGPAVDQILADEEITSPSIPGEVLWPLTDQLGTVRDLATYDDVLDQTTVVNHRVYDAFGNITSETAPTVDHLFAFTGRLWDEDTELQNNLNRWYDPPVGRWLSEDPLGFLPGDTNPYQYVENVPTLNTDSSGLYIDEGFAFLGYYHVYTKRGGEHLGTIEFDPQGDQGHRDAARALAEAMDDKGKPFKHIEVPKDLTEMEAWTNARNVFVLQQLRRYFTEHPEAVYGPWPIPHATAVGRADVPVLKPYDVDSVTFTIYRGRGVCFRDAIDAALFGVSTASLGKGGSVRPPESTSDFELANSPFIARTADIAIKNQQRNQPLWDPRGEHKAAVRNDAGFGAAALAQAGAASLDEALNGLNHVHLVISTRGGRCPHFYFVFPSGEPMAYSPLPVRPYYPGGVTILRRWIDYTGPRHKIRQGWERYDLEGNLK